MRHLTNLAEKRFGKLQVISLEETRQHGHAVWRCFCDCGGTTRVRADALLSGHTTSCGCMKKITYRFCVLLSNNQRWRKHPPLRYYSNWPEYAAYHNAKARCENPKHPAFPLYGGRGIRFYFKSFKDFLGHVGPRPSREHSLDRIDPDGDYVSFNVRWATATEQRANQTPREGLIKKNTSTCGGNCSRDVPRPEEIIILEPLCSRDVPREEEPEEIIILD